MRYEAQVVPGRGEGKKLGFPTLNLEVPATFEADHGIYAGWVWIGEAKFPAAFHYGPVPAFGIQTNSLEAHLIGQDLARTPERLSFELVKYLRPVMDFSDLAGLKAQMHTDLGQALKALEKV